MFRYLMLARPKPQALSAPRTRRQLWAWLDKHLDVQPPHARRCPDHDTPLDYLTHAFFEEEPGDPLVWANRGGGKTFYGAIATLLDLLFKPGVEVRVLGGSLDQSRKMYDYLRRFLDRPTLRETLARGATRRALRLRNGSGVEILAQAETSVRGHHVQKLRCDEVELFDRDIWHAGQFVTKSRTCGRRFVRGSVEALSTMHRPFGLMRSLVEAAAAGTTGGPAHDAEVGAGFRLFKWCALDVMGPCRVPIDCAACDLHHPCGSAARTFRDGFLPARDVLDIRSRTSRQGFEAEMLCRAVTRTDAVYPEFDPAHHVRPVEPQGDLEWVGGMDFGMRSPTVVLWAQLRAMEDPHRPGRPRLRVEVIDEHAVRGHTLPAVLAAIAARPWPRPRWWGVDPAAVQRQSQTGLSTVQVLRDAGHAVRHRRVTVRQGLDAVRRHLDTPDPLLLIHPRCRRLIEALAAYHFDPDAPHREDPVKDGPDHACDALRYLITNLTPLWRTQWRNYLAG